MKVSSWVQFVDKAVDVPVCVQRQRVLVQIVQNAEILGFSACSALDEVARGHPGSFSALDDSFTPGCQASGCAMISGWSCPAFRIVRVHA